jgi:hypothetical protein
MAAAPTAVAPTAAVTAAVTTVVPAQAGTQFLSGASGTGVMGIAERLGPRPAPGRRHR